MLDSTDRNKHIPTLVQCTENSQQRIIHMTGHSLSISPFCFADNKWPCFLTLWVINRCEVKLNLLNVVFEQCDFLNYIDISWEYILKSNLHACPSTVFSLGNHLCQACKRTNKMNKIPCVFVYTKSVPWTGTLWCKPKKSQTIALCLFLRWDSLFMYSGMSWNSLCRPSGPLS